VNAPTFLTLEQVMRLHDMQLERYGGLAGVRDQGLLESAVAMRAASFGGEFLHTDLFAMAAAYLFHIARDHPFTDGNKRTALHATYVFLRLNGFRLDADAGALYGLTMRVASSATGKDEITEVLRTTSVRVV
jgi:death-on-curing protein